MQKVIETIEQIQAAAELSPCGIGLFNIKTSSPVFLNSAYYELVGYTPDEYQKLVKDNDMLMYPQDIAISNKNKEDFSSYGETNNSEYRIVRKDGRVRWVKLNADTVEIKGIPYAYTVFTDITKEKETYDQLTLIAENTNSSISVISVTDKIEKLVYANENFFKLTGVSREEYEKNMHDIDLSLVSPTDRARLHEAVKKAFSCDHPGAIEYQLIRPDGTHLWVRRQFRAIHQYSTKDYTLVSVVTDITQEKETALNMELQQQRFQLVVNELGAAVFEWNFQTGSFYSSDAYQNYAVSLVNPNEILANVGPIDVVHPDDLKILLQYFKDSKSGKERAEARLRLKMINGNYHWCRMIGFFYKDEFGAPTRTIGVILDINSEYEHSFILESILNAMPGGVGIFGFGEKITCEYYSNGFAKMGGYTRKQIDKILKSGTILESLVAPMDIQKASKIFAEKAQKGLPINFNYRFLHHDKSVHWLHLSAAKMRDIGGVPYYYCIFTRPSEETSMYRSIVEDSAIGVFVGERTSRTTLFTNHALNELCGYQAIPEGQSVLEMLKKTSGHPLLTQEEISSLKTDTYTTYQITYNNRYLSIRAKAVIWNDVDAYILYVSDETAEHENQIQQQKLIDEVPGGIGIYDIVDGKVNLTYLNDAYYEMLGMTRESRSQYFGTNAFEAVYEKDRAALSVAIRDLISGKDRTNLLHRVCNGDGKWIWLNLEASVVERDAHHIRVYADFSNCDELIRSQEALKARYEEQVHFANMIASDAVASSMVNLTKQTITRQNTENDEIMEIITSQTPQQGFEAMYPCIPDEEIRKEYAQIFNADRIIADFDKGIERKSIRHPYMNFECWYESTYNAVKNPKTNDLEVYCVARDISKEVQDEYVRQRVISKTYDNIILINPITGEPTPLIENVKSGVYEEQRRLGDYNLGLSSYIIKNSVDEHPEQVAESIGLKAVIKALQNKEIYSVTYSLYNEQHELVRKTASYSYLDKYKVKIICVIQDITSAFEKETAQREALHAALEEVQSISQSKAEFYSRMSHDMRTPMNGILGMTELSRDETDCEKLQTNIKKIRESGEYLLSLINDTLDIQRIESGRFSIEPQIVNTKEIVGNILDMVQTAADAKGVTLKYSAGNTDLGWYIRADAVRLKQIFVNLLSNAVKFTPSGGTVELEFQLLFRDGMISHDVIYVRDTGIGMSEEFLKSGIFKPFSQENNMITANYAGSGLGLSIAKRLVELMHGRIEVKSELGVGTTFAVYLDFERVDDTVAKKAGLIQNERLDEMAEALRGKKILLVEDHPLNAEIAKKLLQKVGCKTDWVKNGQEAVDCFVCAQKYYYDAILMDIRMPVMDGLEATRQIRALSIADAGDIPILAMTANTYAEDINASMEAGMNAHLGKPIVPKLLYKTLAEYISANEK